ncbi:MAG: hypothetical protein LBN24_07880, partial [Mediterranea sp.]|nr:hypothetical protein [Mediterranea sp.]
QVNDRGEMSMTSIYCGNSNIHHVRVRLTAADGSSAESPNSRDSYETTDGSEKIEKADYKLGEDGGVITFVGEHKGQNIRLEFVGDRTYTTNMLPADREAATEVYALQQVLAPMQRIRQEQEAVRVKLRFVEEKKKEEEKKENAGQ